MIYITHFNNLEFNKPFPDVAILEGPGSSMYPELSLGIITISRDSGYAPLVIQEYKLIFGIAEEERRIVNIRENRMLRIYESVKSLH